MIVRSGYMNDNQQSNNQQPCNNQTSGYQQNNCGQQYNNQTNSYGQPYINQANGYGQQYNNQTDNPQNYAIAPYNPQQCGMPQQNLINPQYNNQHNHNHCSNGRRCPACGGHNISYSTVTENTGPNVGIIVLSVLLFLFVCIGWIIAIVLLCCCCKGQHITRTYATCQDCGYIQLVNQCIQ